LRCADRCKSSPVPGYLLQAPQGKRKGDRGGAHLCLGTHLARLETQIAIGKLVQRFTDLELLEKKTTWGRSLFRVPARVPLRFRV